ncbi:Tat pathway signal protein [Hasllibacter sp. MH4015]|uniref:Tat pathway signal protein n=1 Tax=Hasllibacter sp. MH4015 TaxID=2854029 RepID=UPI001CD1CEBD|nr:Tat pathway signal protein [Hasllibacter sp. MH4015]
MTRTNRRQFLILSAAAATAARLAPVVATRAAQSPAGRRVLTLVYDKGVGMMRAVDRLVP